MENKTNVRYLLFDNQTNFHLCVELTFSLLCDSVCLATINNWPDICGLVFVEVKNMKKLMFSMILEKSNTLDFRQVLLQAVRTRLSHWKVLE